MSETIFQKTVLLNNGQQMPIIGLGTGMAVQGEATQAINSALECGYRAIDTAYFYRNEIPIGKEINSWISDGKLNREDIFITTKLPPFGNRAEDVTKFMTKSLQQLHLDYVDLYLIHHPFVLSDDPLLKAKEEIRIEPDIDFIAIWKAMEDQVDAGRAKAIGLSNFNSEQIDRIRKVARIQPACLQVEVHAFLQQKQLLDYCRKNNIVVCCYSPIAAPHTPKGKQMKLLDNSTVKTIATRLGKTPSQVLLKFLLDKGLCIIPKSSKSHRIKENAELDFNLSSEDTENLEALDRGKEGRVYDFISQRPGIQNHKEYPFHASF